MIRLAEKTDIPNLIKMGEKFHKVSGYKDLASYDVDTIIEVFNKLIDDKTLLTDGESGMIGFTVFPVFFNKKKLIAQELFWWVDKEVRNTKMGVTLLANAEKQAKLLGAEALIMLSLQGLNGDRMSDLYESLGYKKAEQTFIRSL